MIKKMTISLSFSFLFLFQILNSILENDMYFHEAHIDAKNISCHLKRFWIHSLKTASECRESRFSVFMLFYNHISKSSKHIFVLRFLLNIVSLYSCIMSSTGTATRRLWSNSASIKVQSAILLGMFRKILYSN